jgi:hypothetical protein
VAIPTVPAPEQGLRRFRAGEQGEIATVEKSLYDAMVESNVPARTR